MQAPRVVVIYPFSYVSGHGLYVYQSALLILQFLPIFPIFPKYLSTTLFQSDSVSRVYICDHLLSPYVFLNTADAHPVTYSQRLTILNHRSYRTRSNTRVPIPLGFFTFRSFRSGKSLFPEARSNYTHFIYATRRAFPDRSSLPRNMPILFYDTNREKARVHAANRIVRTGDIPRLPTPLPQEAPAASSATSPPSSTSGSGLFSQDLWKRSKPRVCLAPCRSAIARSSSPMASGSSDAPDSYSP